MTHADLSYARRLLEELELHHRLKDEEEAPGLAAVTNDVVRALERALAVTKALPGDPALAASEPDDLAAIRSLRPPGSRRLPPPDADDYRRRLQGALLGRFAGCTLGAVVEMWPVERMADWAAEIGDVFPPVDYWSAVPEPHLLRYSTDRCDAYTRGKLDGVPVDDDVTYTLLGLLIAEEYSLDFTTGDVGRAWLRYLPMACTAEHVALNNLRKGVAAGQAGAVDNPYRHWIGADIRSDPWGYLAPGDPERAAGMAWHDAVLSHRRTGIYGAMFFAAAIAAAFVVDDPLAAFEIGLTEIPAGCTLAREIRWALVQAPRVTDYRAARALVDERFAGMSPVHTINNACLTIWGVLLGCGDFTRTIGQTVAMGLDNDCTAATAGSLAGALAGVDGIPDHWHAPFRSSVRTYLNDHPHFAIREVVDRFSRLAAGDRREV